MEKGEVPMCGLGRERSPMVGRVRSPLVTSMVTSPSASTYGEEVTMCGWGGGVCLACLRLVSEVPLS